MYMMLAQTVVFGQLQPSEVTGVEFLAITSVGRSMLDFLVLMLTLTLVQVPHQFICIYWRRDFV